MATCKSKNANLGRLKQVLYFCLVVSLGFKSGFTWATFVSPPIEGFTAGYTRCCYDIEHGELQIIDNEHAYVIPRLDTMIRIPIKIIKPQDTYFKQWENQK